MRTFAALSVLGCLVLALPSRAAPVVKGGAETGKPDSKAPAAQGEAKRPERPDPAVQHRQLEELNRQVSEHYQDGLFAFEHLHDPVQVGPNFFETGSAVIAVTPPRMGDVERHDLERFFRGPLKRSRHTAFFPAAFQDLRKPLPTRHPLSRGSDHLVGLARQKTFRRDETDEVFGRMDLFCGATVLSRKVGSRFPGAVSFSVSLERVSGTRHGIDEAGNDFLEGDRGGIGIFGRNAGRPQNTASGQDSRENAFGIFRNGRQNGAIYSIHANAF